MPYEARMTTEGGFQKESDGRWTHNIRFSNALTGESIEFSGSCYSSVGFHEAIQFQMKSLESTVVAVMTARSALDSIKDEKTLEEAKKVLDQAIFDRTGMTWKQFQNDKIRKLF